MKLTISILLLSATLLFLTGCSKKEASESEKERVERLLLSTTWKINNVNVDGVDETLLFQSMTLKFSINTFTSTNGGLVWEPSGTWQFNNDNGSTIIRDDNIIVTIDQINESQLILSLFWVEDALGGGRITSISGQHVFTFNP